MKRNDLSRALVAFDQDSTIVAVVELSLKTWLVSGLVPGVMRQPLKKQPADPTGCWRCCSAGATRPSRPATPSSSRGWRSWIESPMPALCRIVRTVPPSRAR